MNTISAILAPFQRLMITLPFRTLMLRRIDYHPGNSKKVGTVLADFMRERQTEVCVGWAEPCEAQQINMRDVGLHCVQPNLHL